MPWQLSQIQLAPCLRLLSIRYMCSPIVTAILIQFYFVLVHSSACNVQGKYSEEDIKCLRNACLALRINELLSFLCAFNCYQENIFPVSKTMERYCN